MHFYSAKCSVCLETDTEGRESFMFTETFRLKILEDVQVLLRLRTSASGNYTCSSRKFLKILLAEKHSGFSPYVGSPYWQMHHLISSAEIILFSSLFADSFFFILWLLLPRNICFFLSLRFSFCLSILHFFFPWLCVPSFLSYSTAIFSKERGLEAIYFMGLSDVIGEESLSPARIRLRKKLQYKPHARSIHTPLHSFCTDLAQFFCSLIWGNSLYM